MRTLILTMLQLIAITSSLAFEGTQEYPNFKCEVFHSSGSFHSFIQPTSGEQINIPLEDPSRILNNGIIYFSQRAYITLRGVTKLSTSELPRGSHDQGGWRVSSDTDSRSFRIEIIKTNGNWLGWIIDRDLPEPNSISLASMTCEIY